MLIKPLNLVTNKQQEKSKYKPTYAITAAFLCHTDKSPSRQKSKSQWKINKVPVDKKQSPSGQETNKSPSGLIHLQNVFNSMMEKKAM